MTDFTTTASQTLDLLEERLRRIDILLYGDHPRRRDGQLARENGLSATTRLRNLERGMQTLSSKSSAVSDILALQKQYPELFHHNSPSSTSTLPLPALASLVIAHSGLYRTVASQLSQLQDTTTQDQLSSTKLISQRERIEKVSAKQQAQARELAELRARSVELVEKWYKGGVLEMGECWADWEERLREVEILVRRREAVKRRDDGLI